MNAGSMLCKYRVNLCISSCMLNYNSQHPLPLAVLEGATRGCSSVTPICLLFPEVQESSQWGIHNKSVSITDDLDPQRMLPQV